MDSFKIALPLPGGGGAYKLSSGLARSKMKIRKDPYCVDFLKYQFEFSLDPLSPLILNEFKIVNFSEISDLVP